jgi:formylglycine-generating enzyme required for sulfatase activity
MGLVILTGASLVAWNIHGGAPAARPGPLTDSPTEMKPYVEAVPGSTVKFEMQPIPGGTFLMGRSASDPNRSDDEGPQHPVTLRPFWMGKTEVTWDEYDIFAFSNDIYKKQEQGIDLSKQPEPEKAADAITRPAAVRGMISCRGFAARLATPRTRSGSRKIRSGRRASGGSPTRSSSGSAWFGRWKSKTTSKDFSPK